MLFGGKKFTTVDIGSSGIKVARFLAKKKELSILDTQMVDLPFETVKNSRIQDISIVSSKLENAFAAMEYNPKEVVTAVPGDEVIIRHLELPPLPEDELSESVRWESEEHLPFAASDAVIDYKVLERGEEQTEVLLVAVKKDVFANYTEPFRQIGIKPSVVNVQPMALISLLQYQNQHLEPVAVIDVGASSTRVVIGDEDNIYLARNIDTGGNDFTSSIMDVRNINYHNAEEYKIENGLPLEGEPEDVNLEEDITSSYNSEYLISLASNISEEVARSLKFYTVQHRGEEIERVFITGGGSQLTGLNDLIEEEIGLELEEINPFRGFHYYLEELKDKFAVAVGLGISEVLNDEG
ncbi:MAG: type IV pilus assembly protein PilM [Halanaerobiaceae bacterium]